MDKAEFLNILRQALDKEVSQEIIEQNISFYDQYIGSRSEEDERKVINDIGDPRLIARTIIEKEKMAKQKDFNINRQSYQDSYYEDDDQRMNNENDDNTFGGNIFFTKLKWYHKLIIAAVILLFMFILFALGRIFFSILFTFAVPILIICIIFMLFRRR